jgi:hypothetical protein
LAPFSLEEGGAVADCGTGTFWCGFVRGLPYLLHLSGLLRHFFKVKIGEIRGFLGKSLVQKTGDWVGRA